MTKPNTSCLLQVQKEPRRRNGPGLQLMAAGAVSGCSLGPQCTARLRGATSLRDRA
jgi:hypothetical protein